MAQLWNSMAVRQPGEVAQVLLFHSAPVLQLLPGKCSLQWELKACSTKTEVKLAHTDKSACLHSLIGLF